MGYVRHQCCSSTLSDVFSTAGAVPAATGGVGK
jgi:hypothetical protein